MTCAIDTAAGIASDTLALLGNPPRLAGSLGTVYQLMQQALQFYQNELGLYDGSYLLGSVTIALDANQEEKRLTAEDSFSDPLLCESVPDGWSGPASWRRWELDLVSLKDQMNHTPDYRRMGDLYSWWSDPAWSGRIPASLAWWRDTDGDTHIRVLPAPAWPVTFRLWFNPGGTVEIDPAKQPLFLNNFRHLLTAYTAFLCLPQIREEREDKVFATTEKIVATELERREAQFHRWIENDHTEKSGWAEGFAGSRRGGGYR